ncbi:cobalt-precorrin 5A hydrolase [Methanobrevibacter filiformis]|uniref:Cobalamin biosynthesis protein CbiG n=1 Tax=Methanobrevibacter filiformis TaxID=55758 RepID=A0A166FEX6_9EURY|nr:cobalamin biosynthesis protein [Methanobrevibacter filiformis]KZX17605.1 cobalamin biosynthesis protein CbiG [Methanobrevibacter filiformis]
MKIAILSVSEDGKKLSEDLKSILNTDSTVIKTDIYYKNVKDTIKNIWDSYDAIIAIMATGIIVRSIAPYIINKVKDPAVLSIDDKGKHVISLLSGHLKGANELTIKIANLIDAKPVITTSTDVNNKIGIDTLANHFYFTLNDTKKILRFNKAILNDETINLIANFNVSYICDYLENFNNNFTLETEVFNNKFKKFTLEIDELYSINPNNTNIINDFDINNNYLIAILNNKNYLVMKEKVMVMGIGSRKNISKNTVLIAIKKVMNELGMPMDRINIVATAEIKKDEWGIIEAVNTFKKPINIVDINSIKKLNCPDCSKSEFVQKNFGIDGVSEQCALITAGKNSKLIYKKTAFDGVTIAIAIGDN